MMQWAFQWTCLSSFQRGSSHPVISTWRMPWWRTKGKRFYSSLPIPECKSWLKHKCLHFQAIWDSNSHRGLSHHGDDVDTAGVGSHVEAALCGRDDYMQTNRHNSNLSLFVAWWLENSYGPFPYPLNCWIDCDSSPLSYLGGWLNWTDECF